ncbi:MAG TPA: IclR family transcriptional regulator [Acetobacteraceae bacterium]|nr:IclR family transcriptional regulator [Acetobacteraceae bacterium]
MSASARKPPGKGRRAPPRRAAAPVKPAKKKAAPPPARKPAEEAPDYSIAAVNRALDLLDALGRIGPATLVDIADAAKCSRTATFRLLRTMQARGFALQDEARGLWRLGVRWTALGRAARDQGALPATAQPLMAELGQAVGENVYLMVRHNLQSETVAVFQADPALRVYAAVGERRLLHAGAGRLLLAYAPEPVQTQLLAQKLPRFTPATRTDAAWIAADLPRIRTRGYLITADEVHPGAVSVSAPVRDANGAVVAALCVVAPSMRMRPPRPRSLLPQVLETAAKLSALLGAAASPAKPAGGKPSEGHSNTGAGAGLRLA